LIAGMLNALVFGGSVIWSLAVSAAALAFLAFRIIFSKSIGRKAVQLISVLGILLLLMIGSISGMRTVGSGYLDFDASMAEVEDLLEKGEAYKAGAFLDELEKVYGANDTIQLYKAQAAMEKPDYEAAGSYLGNVANKLSDRYFLVLEKLYLLKEDYGTLQSVYIQAAKNDPLWLQAQLMAGAQSVINKDYAIGEYFLRRAAEQAPADPVPIYYLGVASYEKGDYEEAEGYFSEAMEHGASDELVSYMVWYYQQMEVADSEENN
jgi:tetratricopeptide (TPR) repeat protein